MKKYCEFHYCENIVSLYESKFLWKYSESHYCENIVSLTAYLWYIFTYLWYKDYLSAYLWVNLPVREEITYLGDNHLPILYNHLSVTQWLPTNEIQSLTREPITTYLWESDSPVSWWRMVALHESLACGDPAVATANAAAAAVELDLVTSKQINT